MTISEQQITVLRDFVSRFSESHLDLLDDGDESAVGQGYALAIKHLGETLELYIKHLSENSQTNAQP